MFFLEIAMLNGRAEQDFCTLARDECADPLLDYTSIKEQQLCNRAVLTPASN